jgi:phage baseplate assembly protein W
MMNLDVPFHIDERGRTALTTAALHVRDMLELMLFTHPGERVNRPTFGGGVRQLLFNCNSPELAAALKFSLQSNLQLWLSDVIELRDLTIASENSTLRIEVSFACRRTRQAQTAQFERRILS